VERGGAGGFPGGGGEGERERQGRSTARPWRTMRGGLMRGSRRRKKFSESCRRQFILESDPRRLLAGMDNARFGTAGMERSYTCPPKPGMCPSNDGIGGMDAAGRQEISASQCGRDKSLPDCGLPPRGGWKWKRGAGAGSADLGSAWVKSRADGLAGGSICAELGRIFRGAGNRPLA
jgi:hypothetical protein